MPAIDILLPYYGDVGHMKTAVRSVLSQTETSWRLIVVDDCYPDPEIGRWLAGLEHPSVTYYRNETNLGANETYRRALARSTSEHLVILGADDVMLPNYVHMMQRLIRRTPDAAIIQPGVAVIDEDGRLVRPLADEVKRLSWPRGKGPQLLWGEDLAVSLLRGNWTYFPSLCWSRAHLPHGGFRRGLDVVQDLALILDVVASDGKMVVDRELCFLYRRHRASDSARRTTSGTRFLEEGEYFRVAGKELAARGWQKASRAAGRHVTSRMHSAALAPAAMLSGDLRTGSLLLVHAMRR